MHAVDTFDIANVANVADIANVADLTDVADVAHPSHPASSPMLRGCKAPIFSIRRVKPAGPRLRRRRRPARCPARRGD
jgi:hypothetical protein